VNWATPLIAFLATIFTAPPIFFTSLPKNFLELRIEVDRRRIALHVRGQLVGVG
jgi:hypothetical protein